MYHKIYHVTISVVLEPYTRRKTKALELRVLEFLFNYATFASYSNLFIKVAEITKENYDRRRHGVDLMKSVESCLFKLHLINAIFDEHLEELALEIPLKKDVTSGLSNVGTL